MRRLVMNRLIMIYAVSDSHQENTPIENVTTQKNLNFHMKILIFFIFLLKT